MRQISLDDIIFQDEPEVAPLKSSSTLPQISLSEVNFLEEEQPIETVQEPSKQAPEKPLKWYEGKGGPEAVGWQPKPVSNIVTTPVDNLHPTITDTIKIAAKRAMPNLVRSGEESSMLVGGLFEYATKRLHDLEKAQQWAMNKIGLDFAEGPTAMESLGKGFAESQSAAQRTANKAIKTLESKGYALPPELRQSVMDNPKQILDPRWWIVNVGDTAVSMVPPLIVGMVVGPEVGGAVGGAMEGGSSYNQLLKSGVPKDRAVEAATAYAITSGWLNSLGLEEILTKREGFKFLQRMGGHLKAGLTEAATEGAENPFQAVYEGISKGEKVPELYNDFMAAVKSMPDVMLPSFVTGGAGGTVSDIVDITKSIAERKGRTEIIPEDITDTAKQQLESDDYAKSSKQFVDNLTTALADGTVSIEMVKQARAEHAESDNPDPKVLATLDDAIRRHEEVTKPAEGNQTVAQEALKSLDNFKASLEGVDSKTALEMKTKLVEEYPWLEDEANKAIIDAQTKPIPAGMPELPSEDILPEVKVEEETEPEAQPETKVEAEEEKTTGINILNAEEKAFTGSHISDNEKINAEITAVSTVKADKAFNELQKKREAVYQKYLRKHYGKAYEIIVETVTTDNHSKTGIETGVRRGYRVVGEYTNIHDILHSVTNALKEALRSTFTARIEYSSVNVDNVNVLGCKNYNAMLETLDKAVRFVCKTIIPLHIIIYGLVIVSAILI